MQKLKSNKGITMVDVITSIIILSIFVGVIGSLYVKITTENINIKKNTIATYYAVKIAEYTDEISYEQVNNENLSHQIETICNDIPEDFIVTVNVENYNELQNIIKKVTINIEYSCFNDTRSYKIEKLKIKEM